MPPFQRDCLREAGLSGPNFGHNGTSDGRRPGRSANLPPLLLSRRRQGVTTEKRATLPAGFFFENEIIFIMIFNTK